MSSGGDLELNLLANDQISPVLAKINAELTEISSRAAKAAQGMAISIADLQRGPGRAEGWKIEGDQLRGLEEAQNRLKSVKQAVDELFERQGGVKQWFIDTGEAAKRSLWRDPESFKKLNDYQIEGLKRVNEAEKENLATETQLGQMYEQVADLQNRKGDAEERLARQGKRELDEMAKHYQETGELQKNVTKQTTEAINAYHRQQTEQTNKNIESVIAKSAELDQQETEAYEKRVQRAKDAGWRAGQQMIRDMRERRIMESQEEGGAGTVGGGFLTRIERAAGGGFLGRAVKDIAWGIESFFRYELVWKSAEFLLSKVGDAFNSVGNEVNAFGQIMGQQGKGFTETARDLDQITKAAVIYGTTVKGIADTQSKLYAAGFGSEQSQYAAEMIEVVKKKGIDPTDAIVRARYYQATAQDLMNLSRAGGAFAELRGPGVRLQQLEAEEPFKQAARQRDQISESRTLQDRIHGAEVYWQQERNRASDAMEDEHRAIRINFEEKQVAVTREIEDNHRIATEAMEDDHYRRNRDMELAHRNAEREMADQHRLASHQEQDTERHIQHADTLHQRQVGFYESLPGAMDVLQGKSSRYASGYAGAEFLRAEMEKGYAEMEKEGLPSGVARLGVSEGMSPSAVLQFAQAAREEERYARQEQNILNARQRETDEIRLQRQIQDESFSEADRQHEESIRTVRELNAETRTVERAFADEQRRTSVTIAKEETELRRTIRNTDLQMAIATYNMQIALERKYQDMRLEDEKELMQARIEASQALLLSATAQEEIEAAGARSGPLYAGLGRVNADVGVADPRTLQRAQLTSEMKQLMQDVQDIYDRHIDTVKSNNSAMDLNTDSIIRDANRTMQQATNTDELTKIQEKYSDSYKELQNETDSQINKARSAAAAEAKQATAAKTSGGPTQGGPYRTGEVEGMPIIPAEHAERYKSFMYNVEERDAKTQEVLKSYEKASTPEEAVRLFHAAQDKKRADRLRDEQLEGEGQLKYSRTKEKTTMDWTGHMNVQQKQEALLEVMTMLLGNIDDDIKAVFQGK